MLKRPFVCRPASVATVSFGLTSSFFCISCSLLRLRSCTFRCCSSNLVPQAHFACGAFLRAVHLLAQHRLLDYPDNFGLRACHLAARRSARSFSVLSVPTVNRSLQCAKVSVAEFWHQHVAWRGAICSRRLGS